MSQPKYVTALDLKELKRDELSPDKKKYFDVCDEKLGFVPNVLRAYAFDEKKLAPFMDMYDELMMGESELSKLEREMIAVAVSSVNHCFYCLTAHGSAVRRLSKDPKLGELMIMNFRVAELDDRLKAMLEFSVKLTEKPNEIIEKDRQILRDHGFSDQGIWDICSVVGFFSMTNRLASGVDMQPNEEYHASFR